MRQLVYDATIVAGLMPRISSPADTWKLPFSPSGGDVYLTGEAKSEDTPDLNPTRVDSANVTITAKTLAARIPFSYILEEDAITSVSGMFRDYSVRLMAEAIDSAIVNGDTTSTHQDTGKSYAATAPQKAWNGLRDIAMNTFSSATKDCSTFSADNILATLMLGSNKYIQTPRRSCG